MTDADKYWHRKLVSNPTLAVPNSRVTMKSSALEKEIRKAFEEGKRVGTRQGIQVGKLAKVSDTELNALDDLFKQTGDK